MEIEVIKKKEGIFDRNTGEIVKRKKRVAAYARVSTDNEEQQTSFISQQKYYIDKIEKEPDWKFVEVYADEGISGTQTAKRENFLRMIRDAEDDKIDLILTKSISRFARNTVDTLKYVRLLRNKNVAVIFEEENINTLDMSGELLLSILSSVAQQESETISSHVRLGIKMKEERGELVGFNGVYGYTCDMKRNELILNEEEAKTVRLIYKLFLDGYGCNMIAKTLSELNICSPRGKEKWGTTTINNILKNEKYIGDVEMGKTFTVDPITHKRKVNTGEEDKFYLKGHHEPIISEEDFNMVQEIFKSKQQKRKEGKSIIQRKSPFTELLRCGYCGSLIIKKSSYKRPAWECKSVLNIGRYYCKQSRAAYEDIIKKVFMDGIKMLIDPKNDDIDSFIKDLGFGLDDDQVTSTIIKLKDKKRELESKISSLVDLFIDKKLDSMTFEKKRDALSNKVDEITNKINQLEKREDNSNKDERINNIKRELLSSVNDDSLLLNYSFNDDLFKLLVSYVVIGGFDENGESDPFMIRFILKNDINEMAKFENVISEEIVENNDVSKCKNKLILQFDSNQSFYTMEKTDTINRKVLHNSIKVRFEVENV